ncbi:hypothetical protein EI42_04812 [Thermosporothrix hazakensis]|jgi:hypothetical protein|uniref:Uncharacterized protein n=1 Tax=Thermosporothrix hazakensis TaxID=644383 RepID=A0A326U9L1_THEHA|nr:ABC transporter permease [Thermosporothrix hazakensis]PZW23889.1 hypothetical protein EI42_04812 [Thermosporothrix hazakensis]GCE48508.1 hypothetical protein KTH_33770 [Thermosporothrix hazakensis]
MGRRIDGFRDFIGSQWRRVENGLSQWSKRNQARRFPAPKEEPPRAEIPLSLDDRLNQSFDRMLQEVDELDSEKYTFEEHAEYTWIAFVRVLLPLIFFVVLGYEDGLFMTGFHYFSWEPFIAIMYFIGYGLEALRVAMVYSMNFSKAAGREKAYRAQFWVWLLMSLGCGVAQLASALVIQSLGGDQAISGENAVAQGAKEILASMPWLVYLAIILRVALCAIADWACSGFLHRKKKTVEQKAAAITARANNVSALLQANQNARSIIDNARQYQQIVESQRKELEALRTQQREVFDVVFNAGMAQVKRNVSSQGSEPDNPYEASFE